ncbi:hypothetical protein ABK040_016882 [Willaertia magna]
MTSTLDETSRLFEVSSTKTQTEEDSLLIINENNNANYNTYSNDLPTYIISTNHFGNFEFKREKLNIKLILKKIWNNLFSMNEKLGWIMGVLIPCILSIFGVILYLRLGFVIGQAGLLLTLAQFILAYSVVLLTSLSVSAISTNGNIKGGGTYYLISRILGAELGGSIGIIFFIANVMACCVNILGFVEAFDSSFRLYGLPIGRWWNFLYATITLIVLSVICFVGANFFAKMSILIFLVLIFSIIFVFISLCFQTLNIIDGYTGFNWETFTNNLLPSFTTDKKGNVINFQVTFGILFPACIGIMSGVNMSGDLKDPTKAIPKGTISAVGFTFVTYISLVFVIAFTVVKDTLINNTAFMSQLSLLTSFIVTVGIFAAALSSALGNIIGASRILQAVAKDQLLPFISFFKKGSKKRDEPRRAVIFTYILVQLILLIGDLNAVAPIVTQFYLLCYCFTNFSCFILSITGAPNFRPLFKYFSWHTAAIGAFLSIFGMFFTNPLYAGISIGVFIILSIIIYFYAPNKSWGEISQSIIYHQVRKYLLRLDKRKDHVKYWRLNILHFISNPKTTESIQSMLFLNELKKGGLYLIGNVVKGDLNIENLNYIKELKTKLYEFILQSKMKAFIDVVTSINSIKEGLLNLMLTSGIGEMMQPNTIVMGLYEKNQKSFNQQTQLFEMIEGNDKKKQKLISIIESIPNKEKKEDFSLNEYIDIMKNCLDLLQKNLIITTNFYKLNRNELYPKSWKNILLAKKHLTIDLWPLQFFETINPTVSLILQMGFMINLVGPWSRYHKLRIFSIIENNNILEAEMDRLKKVLRNARVNAEIIIITLTVDSFESFSDNFISYQHVNDIAVDYKTTIIDNEIDNHQLYSKFNSLSILEKHKIINKLMKKHSENTSVIFMSLPKPPEQQGEYENYLNELQVLSNDLPPTMLVSGLTNVIASEL